MASTATTGVAGDAAEQFLNTPALQTKAENDGITAVLDALNVDITKEEFKDAIRALTIEHVSETNDSNTKDPGEKKLMYTATCVCTCKCSLSC